MLQLQTLQQDNNNTTNKLTQMTTRRITIIIKSENNRMVASSSLTIINSKTKQKRNYNKTVPMASCLVLEVLIVLYFINMF